MTTGAQLDLLKSPIDPKAWWWFEVLWMDYEMTVGGLKDEYEKHCFAHFFKERGNEALFLNL